MDTNAFEAIREEYRARHSQHNARRQELTRTHRLCGTAKLVLVALFALAVIATSGPNARPDDLLALPVILFIAVAVRHEKVLTALRLEIAAVAHYAAAMDRAAGKWQGRGQQGSRFQNPAHPYADDLDLFGSGSLFERICAARTAEGEAMLASWLMTPAAADTVRARQAAVKELAANTEFRASIAVLSPEAAEAAQLDTVTAWGRQEMPPIRAAFPLAIRAITAATVVATAYGGFTGNWQPTQLLVVVGQLTAAAQAGACRKICKDLDHAGQRLEVFAGLLTAIEKAAPSFQSPLLQQISARITGGESDRSASTAISELTRIIAWRDSLRSSLFTLIGIALLWPTHCALALRIWRQKHGARIGEWLDAAAEMEALCSLARWAYERPDAVYPDIIEGTGPLLQLTEARHPLIRPEVAIPNTLQLDAENRLVVISGSNMSGKSTLLRTTGCSVVLALAGAPVTAEAMRCSPLHIGASLRTNDSLNAGVSRFYAEITRLKQIVELAQQKPPALFLLDEILHGTNSHDRAIGAEAVMKSLIERGAIGLVTTHDLALTRLATEPQNTLHATNLHMQDEMVEGKMVFDYRLRPGVVQHSNALPLMRAVGLDV
jgi:MutS domain V